MPTIRSEPENSQPQLIYEHPDERRAASTTVNGPRKTTAEAIGSGSTLEAIGGGGAVVLAIIALAGYLPFYLTSIAAIAVGGAMFLHGLGVAVRWNDTVRRVGSSTSRAELVGGLGFECLGGAAGVVLGILALVGVSPLVLLPIAAIVLGGSALFGAPEQAQIAQLAPAQAEVTTTSVRSARAASGLMAIVGVGAAVLGILAVLDIGPRFVLSEIAMLGVGGALFIAGTVLAVRFARATKYAH